MARIRVVPDSNVLISGLMYPTSIPGLILQAGLESRLSLVTSRYILDEVQRVLPRLKRNPFTSDEILDLIDGLTFQTELVEPDSLSDPSLRDVNDQAVLATWRAAQAQYLITGDKDLLSRTERYPVVSPAAFWARHGE